MRVEGNAIVLLQNSNHSARKIKQTKLEKFKSYDCSCYGGELKDGKIKLKKMILIWGNGICSRIVG